MLKQLVIGLLLIHVVGSDCQAQGAAQTSKIKTTSETGKKSQAVSSGTSTRKNTSKQTQKAAPVLMAITFTTTETCTLKINGKEEGTIIKGSPKIIKLPVGTYRLFFESKETDVTKNVPSFAVSRNVTYAVSFENPIAQTPTKLDTPQQQNGGTAIVENKPPPVNKPISPEEAAAARMSEKQRATISTLASEMVPMQGGSFTMGAPKLRDAVQHTVTIRALNFGMREVTQERWETIMGYNNSSNQGCPDCPVENVNWTEVDSFIRKINSASKKKFRLPTEAEWEYVATRGIKAAIGKPKEEEFEEKLIDLFDSTAWYASSEIKSTQPVGRKQPVSGVFDLFGNVAEWCSNYYAPDYQKDNPDNPTGPPTGEKKVVKGGSYTDDKTSLYPPARDKEKPSAARKTLGFRLVMSEN